MNSFASRHDAFRNSRGFTLIELMITVVIISILAAIAIPSYTAYVVRTHRTAAKACMLEFAQSMERYYTTNMTYDGADPSLGCTSDGGIDTKYTFAVDTPSARRYTITATPIGAQLARDTDCGTLTLNEAGERTNSGSAALEKCW